MSNRATIARLEKELERTQEDLNRTLAEYDELEHDYLRTWDELTVAEERLERLDSLMDDLRARLVAEENDAPNPTDTTP